MAYCSRLPILIHRFSYIIIMEPRPFVDKYFKFPQVIHTVHRFIHSNKGGFTTKKESMSTISTYFVIQLLTKNPQNGST